MILVAKGRCSHGKRSGNSFNTEVLRNFGQSGRTEGRGSPPSGICQELCKAGEKGMERKTVYIAGLGITELPGSGHQVKRLMKTNQDSLCLVVTVGYDPG